MIVIFTRYLFCFFVIGSSCLFAQTTGKLKVLLNSCDQTSIAQHLALYELYPHTQEGQQALQKAWQLLSGNPNLRMTGQIPLPNSLGSIQNIVALVNKQPSIETALLSDEDLSIIEQLSSRLANNSLKGRKATSEEEVLQLPPEEIDIARGLFLSQVANEPDAIRKIRSYEAAIDLMALQILARLKPNSTPEEKIRAINHLIFEELDFRFPPHSIYAKDIDLYTFLPSVLDSRRGVCLGVSILYMCIAQRINLKLEMITPPGHIYVRYRNGDKIINIETTARGINLPCEVYLGINTRKLKQRDVKQVIGMAHFNQASVYWLNGEHNRALEAYSISRKYMGEDPLLLELMAYNYLFSGEEDKGRELLEKVKNHLPDYAVYKDTIAEDYITNNADAEGIKALFMHVDENRSSILEKKNALNQALERHPNFRSAYFQLANVHLQLHQETQALEALEHYHKLDPNDPSAEYYLTVLLAKRLDYNKAWEHLKRVERIVKAREHQPKALKTLRKELSLCCPE